MKGSFSVLIKLAVMCTLPFSASCMTVARKPISQHVENIGARVRDLKKRDLLDGEVLIAQGEHILLHEMSQEVRAVSLRGQAPQFMIASLSKQFTAVALLKVLYDLSPGKDEQGKCDHVMKQLHRPLIDYLTPEVFPWGATVPPWAYEVTLYHLLTHTAGLVQHIRILFETEGHKAVQSCMHKGHGPEYIVQKWGHEPLQFLAGSEFSYSNLGYELLAKVVAVLAKIPFEEYLQIGLFEPLGLNSTYQPSLGTSKQLRELAYLKSLLPEMVYDGFNAQLCVPQSYALPDSASAQGSGGVISTAHDLLTWNRVLHEEKRVLPKALYDRCITVHKNCHGFGLFNRSGVLSYTGNLGAYTALLIYIPECKLSAVGLWHVDQDEGPYFELIKALEDQMSETINDDKERQEIVMTLLKEKYPQAQRGSSALLSFILDELHVVK